MQRNFDPRVVDAITPVFRQVFDDPALILTEDLNADDVPLWDSLNHIVLIVELEALTGLTFGTDQLAALANVGDFVELIANMGYRGHA
jgi:acyl carrier protein